MCPRSNLRSQVYALIDKERERQDVIHGGRTAADDIPAFLKVAVLVKGVGELSEGLIEQRREILQTELEQVAAVAVAWLESLLEGADNGG